MSDYSVADKPKISIIGHGRHGKDTVAEILRDDYGYSLIPASWTFAEVVMRYRCSYSTTQDCFEDRVNHRKLWGDAIEEYNTPNPGKLAELVLSEGSDLYVGCRRLREFKATKHLFKHIIWVDRSQHLPHEGKGSMELSAVNATIFLDNNGSIEDLHSNLNEVMKEIHK